MNTLVISNFKTGLETNLEPFNIDNDAFPVLNNAYIWRGRIKKKRGTQQLGRLQRDLTSASAGTYSTINGTNTYNIFTGLAISGTEATAQIIPGNIKNITITFAAPIGQTLTDTLGNGTMTVGGAGPIVSATINYSTGIITITGNAAVGPANVTVTLSYFPTLPVMGIEDFDLNFNINPGITNFPVTVFLDTKYSYQFNQTTQVFYSTSFYKNTGAPIVWSGADYQQFWSANWQGALWVTNAKPGFQFKVITGMPVIGANSQFTIVGHGLTNNDFVFINEVNGVTGVNGVSGQVTFIDANTFSIPTPGAAGAYISGGIAQYLTRSVSNTQDGIRWYDGDPVADPTKGWVNFAPPLQNTLTPQYLVGAKVIFPFKDRLLFFGTYTQTSAGTAVYNPNQVVYSWNGTAYYASPVPVNQTFDVSAYYQNVFGRGGFLDAYVNQEVINVAENQDLLIVNFETQPLKLIFTADSSLPFIFQTISPELGSQSTFACVPLDTGVLSVGPYGFVMTTAVNVRRIDLAILDQVFEISAANNGSQRVTAVRDFRNEFVYFTYPSFLKASWKFPNRTLLYNYRENNWATFDENYTHYGTFRRSTGTTWANLGKKYGKWKNWLDPWNFGANATRYPSIVGGNQQGFIMIKDEGTYEDNSQFIQAISGTTITSPNHCLNYTSNALATGEYIQISGCLGDPGITAINGQIYKVQVTEGDLNTFSLLPTAGQPIPSGTYLGGGVYKRLTNIFIQSKMFPIFWGQGRKVRIGDQFYLLDTTTYGEIIINLYTSQTDSFPSNDPFANPSFPFSNILLTRPEPPQFGEGIATQNQIWHRMSTSVIGDTVQIGFQMSDTQMRDTQINSSEITIHAIAMKVYPGPILA